VGGWIAPRDATGKSWTHQLQLTIADFVVEIHDTHHPIGGGLYRGRSRRRRRAADFRANRLPKYLGYFRHVLQLNPARGHGMVGAK
jgi:glutathione S-transferase